jgi:hypothetical protein
MYGFCGCKGKSKLKCDSRWEIAAAAAGRTRAHCTVSTGVCREGPGTLGTGTLTLVYTSDIDFTAQSDPRRKVCVEHGQPCSLAIAYRVGPGVCRPCLAHAVS